MRHVGDRVAVVVAESEEIALEALKLIDTLNMKCSSRYVDYLALLSKMRLSCTMNRWCMLLVRQILWKTITAMQPSAASI